MQHVANPGYNTNRGPVSVGSVRLHVDFWAIARPAPDCVP